MTTETPSDEQDIPTLTDIVTPGAAPPPEAMLAAVQAEITARAMKLAEELLHNTAREMEALLLEKVCDQLRSRLPDIIDETLRARLK
jgi:hypothetical protein